MGGKQEIINISDFSPTFNTIWKVYKIIRDSKNNLKISKLSLKIKVTLGRHSQRRNLGTTAPMIFLKVTSH